jgi:hypothetical protein
VNVFPNRGSWSQFATTCRDSSCSPLDDSLGLSFIDTGVLVENAHHGKQKKQKIAYSSKQLSAHFIEVICHLAFFRLYN